MKTGWVKSGEFAYKAISAHGPSILCVSGLFIFSLLIRIHGLSDESLWMDELRQASYYRYSFRDILYLAASQQQPPLDYWIGRIIYL